MVEGERPFDPSLAQEQETAMYKPGVDSERFMEKIARIATKLPGGKMLLPAIGILSMASAGAKAEISEKTPAQEFLSAKRGFEMTMPLEISAKFMSGVTKKTDGSYVFTPKELPARDTMLGDLYYQSNNFSGKFEGKNIPEIVEDDIQKFEENIDAACGTNTSLAETIKNKFSDLAKKIWPGGLGKKAYIEVKRASNNNQIEEKTIPATWATVGDAVSMDTKHYESLIPDLIKVPDGQKTQIMAEIIDQYGDINQFAVAGIMVEAEENK